MLLSISCALSRQSAAQPIRTTLGFQIIWSTSSIISRAIPLLTFHVQISTAQTRLARELDRRPDLYDVYLEELFTLFSDKGVAIQNTASSGHLTKVSHCHLSADAPIKQTSQMDITLITHWGTS